MKLISICRLIMSEIIHIKSWKDKDSHDATPSLLDL